MTDTPPPTSSAEPADHAAAHDAARRPSGKDSGGGSGGGPNHRDLYMLVGGLVLGILLGPAVLGRLAPETYARHFGVIESAAVKLAIHDVSRQQVHQQLVASGLSAADPALGDFERRHAQDRLPYVRAVQQARIAQGRLVAVIVAVVILMIIETLPDPRAAGLRARLATARYGLMALALALSMAQPSLWLGLPVAFLALLLAVAVGVACVPLGRQAGRACPPGV